MRRKTGPTAAERRHMGRVAALGCIITGEEAEVHHIRVGCGTSQRSSPYLTIPLSPDLHRGSLSIHNSKRQFESIYGDELDLLALTIKKLMEDE